MQIRDADRAIKEAFNSPSSCMLQESSFLEQILLIALLLEIRQTGKCEVSMSDVADRINILCTDSPPSYASVLASAMSLASRRLVLCSPGMHRTRMKISLNVPTDDLMYVLTNDQALSPLISRLS